MSLVGTRVTTRHGGSSNLLMLLVLSIVFSMLFLEVCNGDPSSNPPRKDLNSEELKRLFPDNPVLLDPEYKLKSGLLLSQEWDIAETHFNVQDELYEHIAIPCFNCSVKYAPNNCACDYSDPNNCGKVPKGCPLASCPQNLTDIYCNKDLPNWSYVSADSNNEDVMTSDWETMEQGETKYFRFYVADPCTGFQIRLNYEYGMVETYVSTLSSLPGSFATNILFPYISNTTWSTSANYRGHSQITICPALSTYKPGTFTIATICREISAKFRVEIYKAKAITQRPESVGGGPIIGVSGTKKPVYCYNSTSIVCLNDTEPYTFNGVIGTFPLFRITVTGKKGECAPPITVFLENLIPGTYSFLLVSYVRAISYTEASIIKQSKLPIRVASIYTVENIYHGQYCFEETGTFGIFLTAEAFIPVSFRITYTTIAPYHTKRLNDLSPYQYGHDATNVVQMLCEDGERFYCDEWLYGCQYIWQVYPSTDETDPFWPTPAAWGVKRSQASNDIFQNIIRHETPLLSPSNDTLTSIVVLRNNLFGKETVRYSEKEFEKCWFESSNTVFNKEGKVLLGKTLPARKVEPKCEPEQIKKVVSIGESYVTQISESKSFGDLLQLTFQANTLFFTDAWLGCSNYTSAFLLSKQEDLKILTTECFSDNITSSAFLKNPCCNSALLVNQCCIASPKSTETTVYTDVYSSKIDRVCNAPSCVNSYMLDYLVLAQQKLSCSSFSSQEYPLLYTRSLEYYVECKAKYNVDKLAFGTVKCTSDANCYFGGVKNKCNYATSRCILSSEAEKKAFDCVVDGLDEYKEYYLKERFSLPGRKDEEVFRSALLDAVTTSDCINSQGSPTFNRNGYIYQPSVASCTCASTKCLDQTCEILPASCQQACFLEWVPLVVSKSTCESQQKCNWAVGTQCTSKLGCGTLCGTSNTSLSTSFCAYCDSDAYCTPIPGITTQADCENAQACMLPQGKITLTTTKDQCQSTEGCSQLCPGNSCQSANGGDVCLALISQPVCILRGGIWRTDIISTGVCSYELLGSSLCLAKGGKYYSCSNLTLAQCSTCNSKGPCPVNQTIAKCYVSPKRPCVSEKECKSKAGYCTDQDFLVSLTTIPPTFGACIYPPKIEFYQDAPTCTSNIPTAPSGCYRFQNQTVCAAAGAKYHPLAMSKEECEGPLGCSADLQLRAYLSMTTNECKKCNRIQESFYQWTDGYPVSGMPVSLQWKQNEAEELNNWKKTIDWQLLHSALVDSVSATVLTDIRSGVVCNFNARASLFETITCACLNSDEDNVDQCFNQQTSIQTGTGEACIALKTTIQTTTGSVEFNVDSVDRNSKERCLPISIYSSSIYTLEQPEQVAYSPLSRVREYDSFNVVLNDDNAIVGRVMSDGFEVRTSDAESLTHYTLCIRLSSNSGDPPSSFDVWDFGYRDGYFLVAMDVKVSSSKLQDLYCGDITNPSKDVDYFLIKRLDNYKAESGSLYTDGETACWWAFAALFTAISVWGIAMIVAHYLGMSLHYYFRIAMLAFSAMSATRAIYFYLLAARALEDKSDNAGTFFLVEFPTLMYITAFSCISAFWLFLLVNHQKRVILVSTGFFNVFVYLIFITLIVLFATLPVSEEESQCKGREPVALDNTSTKVVSIVYQSIMAGISVFLALFILAAGSRLFLGLQQKLFERKVALVTLICTLGLLLHCSFILYLSATFTDNFTIIVLMIVLSELVPITLIMFQFSIMRASCFGKIKVPKYNRARMLSTLKGKGSTPTTGGSTHGSAATSSSSADSKGADSKGSKSNS